MILNLPYPVSANRYWRHVPNKKTGRTMHFLSDEAKNYKKIVGWTAKAIGMTGPTEKPIHIVRIVLVPRLYNEEGKRVGGVIDLGNCWKIAEDALQGVIYVNDKQIKKIGGIEYADAPTDKGGLIVEIKEFIPKAAPIFELAEATS